ncbi:hypothetical protein [Alkalicoccobacillus plakortidis]|uniref:Uncharacterized protein n=1 Tax=Alkalicoccobacillus plakortidis TaxID=444060 RepID=A0ABT0XFE8_9BACI|nr:hypothetical protein [Alkalicoccobacillus plakortidis]MCM2674599.1 hypothetical protein [Alkalicoccobacillus plakortidis]
MTQFLSLFIGRLLHFTTHHRTHSSSLALFKVEEMKLAYVRLHILLGTRFGFATLCIYGYAFI